jgi:hypothetical protein
MCWATSDGYQIEITEKCLRNLSAKPNHPFPILSVWVVPEPGLFETIGSANHHLWRYRIYPQCVSRPLLQLPIQPDATFQPAVVFFGHNAE